MRKKLHGYFVVIAIILNVFVFGQIGFSQDRIQVLENRLIALENRIPGLTDTIGISVENLSLQSFLVAVMKESDVNLSISPGY